MASTQANAPATKPSFAKIAAAGLKPPSTQQTQSNNNSKLQKRVITSAPRDGGNVVIPSSGPGPQHQAVQSRTSAQSLSPQVKEPGMQNNRPEVRVHNVDGAAPEKGGACATSGMLAPTTSADDSTTQLSTSSGSAKPPSLDDKSVASGTTFALDEKESLRPDDSASVNAVEDDETFLAPSSVPSDSQNNVEFGVRAFRDQLREISAMEPSRHGVTPQPYGPPTPVAKGVLYVPPAAPGVGVVPQPAGTTGAVVDVSGFPPDPKLLEALDSPRDRLMVMKLQTDIVDFIIDAKEVSLTLPQCNAYHRMLAHKAADYYMLGHVVDDASSGVRLFKTPTTCLRPPLIDTTAPSTAASTPPPNAPQMKILRRGMDTAPAIVNGSNLASKSGSDDEEDKKSKLPLTREEREARYEAVRLRIMGASKPSGSPEDPKPKDSSRSSSAAGKKLKKKQRSDSEDGFEARSAYSAYYTPPYSTTGTTSNTFGYAPSHDEPIHRAPLNRDSSYGAYQPYAAQGQGNMQWSGYGYPDTAGQQSPYDLAQDFQRAMSFQPMAAPQQAVMQPGYNYQQQYYGAQQSWPAPPQQQQQQYQILPQPVNGQSSFYGGYQSQGLPTNIHELQPYRFGQLPSQTYPGRTPNSLEHPLPGSYKGKHFNPQSQAFVPTQPSSSSARPFTPQGSAQIGTGTSSPYAANSPLLSMHGQASTYSSPHHAHAIPTPSYAQAQPMLHPLPQPVFPRQPSPSLPLPPKPSPLLQQQPSFQVNAPPPLHASLAQQSSSGIAKWGIPASLPAKPPLPAQPFDAAKFPQLQRQTSYTSAAAVASVPSGGAMPNFGSMPPVVGAGGHRQ
ncbi:hypothetical protein LTR02_006792 [Friedmanniomyces endolithicus]|nr:hypothetical protein LTR94_009126 [Friedmanniomyces endolithicus]KAK0796979.1 hypothetical protein LTR38_008390 [Friedmanniomyces endolithicus]KAK0803218.1 hypothetical protein LTR59_004781 [Friedmanniomyces endolithicus]KAK0810740.1 hypothetical protein LTR75_005468 [Friedmanniomyces endolithicus]KAK0849660.1 hypothetical protein LTR03_005078 [Friedmanniomyces endolithicus]